MPEPPDRNSSPASDQDGQVSEVSGLPAESEIDPISPGDATAGAPDEAGETQEGTAGPDAPPRHGRPEPSNESSR